MLFWDSTARLIRRKCGAVWTLVRRWTTTNFARCGFVGWPSIFFLLDCGITQGKRIKVIHIMYMQTHIMFWLSISPWEYTYTERALYFMMIIHLEKRVNSLGNLTVITIFWLQEVRKKEKKNNWELFVKMLISPKVDKSLSPPSSHQSLNKISFGTKPPHTKF